MSTAPDTISSTFMFDCLELLALAFRGPVLSTPDANCPGVLTSGVLALFEDAGELPVEIHEPLSRMAQLVMDADSEGAFCEQLETEYVRLFIANKGGITAPLYQSCYENIEAGAKGRMMGASALAMQQLLDDAGLAVGVQGNDPADHLSTELEYTYFLLHRDQQASPVEKAAKEFVHNALLPWVTKLEAKLLSAAQDSYYCHAVQLLVALLQTIQKN